MVAIIRREVAIPVRKLLLTGGAGLRSGFGHQAIADPVRIGEPFFMPVLAGVLVWLGLYLPHARLRTLIPLRK